MSTLADGRIPGLRTLQTYTTKRLHSPDLFGYGCLKMLCSATQPVRCANTRYAISSRDDAHTNCHDVVSKIRDRGQAVEILSSGQIVLGLVALARKATCVLHLQLYALLHYYTGCLLTSYPVPR
jgi:hypothetical protein